ncbi:hypothetical protein BU24DRAFT_434167 [Aaosphaeria arxii CBS 175.79]|uniref:CFEM domain-containing protein n=1 Tax=Aaosphaeria arxii CBS 175.79 TaxID=1450172 RepID=A0A6A5XQZ1_9PLEO|nr:uncharacterized protein BU24DRAFT_434167 [Aaosphaeria arxii CBS 175.79]KAF2015120.1 hypothetical protein BU24DRAFT_434167 [Aaosphaeria arxii CBS 175.79]
MKVNLIPILFGLVMMVGLVSGQSQILPKCGLDCITKAVLNLTCAPTNIPCICTNAALQSQAHQCVLGSCTIREQLVTLRITNTQCGVRPARDRSWVPPMIFFIIFAGIIFILRLVSRIVCHSKLWWDDFFNLLGAVGCVAHTTVGFVGANLGFGTDIWAVPPENITKILILAYIEFILYNWCEITLRTSVLLFYLRIFATGTAPRLTFWAVLIISDTLSVGFFLFNIFQCTPIKHFWQHWDGEHEGYCVGANKVSISGGVIDLFWTLVILVVPLPHILRLQLPLYKKFAVTVMFAWGIWCVLFFITLAPHLTCYSDGIGLQLWSGIELDVAVICACLPSVYPLFLRMIRRRRPQDPLPMPDSSVATIGGSGGKRSGNFKRRDHGRVTAD